MNLIQTFISLSPEVLILYCNALITLGARDTKSEKGLTVSPSLASSNAQVSSLPLPRADQVDQLFPASSCVYPVFVLGAFQIQSNKCTTNNYDKKFLSMPQCLEDGLVLCST